MTISTEYIFFMYLIKSRYFDITNRHLNYDQKIKFSLVLDDEVNVCSHSDVIIERTWSGVTFIF